MVDSINPTPQNNIPENPVQEPTSIPASSQSSTNPGNAFYSGFDKPNEVQVNLAASGEGNQGFNQPPVNEVPVETGVADSRISDFKPHEPVNHTVYNGQGEPINWRGVLFIVGVGVAGTVIFGLISYFSASAIYKGKLSKAELELSELTQKVNQETKAPEPLELPVQVTTPTTPVTQPVVTPPAEEPIQTPATTPVTTPTGGTEANG